MADEPESGRTRLSLFDRANVEYWALVAEIAGGVAVVVSLVFVGIQLRDANTVTLRAEANSTQEQWTSFNASIYGSADTADILHAAMTGSRPLDPVEQLRFAFLLREQGWLTYQGWERVRAGLRPPESFFEGAGPDLVRVICTPGGRMTWPRIRIEFPPDYVAELDGLIAAHAGTDPNGCPPPPSAS